jgi:FkbM family methyltransferase
LTEIGSRPARDETIAMFEDLRGISNKIDEFLDSASQNPVVVLYGAGFAMPAILDKLERYGFSVVAICDSNTSKHGNRFRDTYPVMSVEQARADFPDARFLISSPEYFDEISAYLRGILDERQLCDVDLECAHYFEKGEFHAFFKSNFERFCKVHDLLDDDASKETYFRVIKAHRSGQRKDFEAAFTGNDDWYLFQSLLKPVADTVYVDCGAYDGDTIGLFLRAADQGYRKIVALEPDPAMLPRLNAISQAQGGKIEIVAKGASDKDGILKFKANGVYSAIVENDAEDDELISISTTRLDTLLKGERVSIIKMDIEGGEYDALNGAAGIIATHKPRLAICLYHKVVDFVRIAELLLRLVPEYKLSLRHQTRSCTDTILFASLD